MGDGYDGDAISDQEWDHAEDERLGEMFPEEEIMNQPTTPTPTPGNWRPGTTEPRAIVSDCDCAAVDCRRQLLCRSYGGHFIATTIWNLGDIPLIAAAPKLLAACKEAAELYDYLALGSLEAAATYGPDYEPPSNEDCLAVRGALAAAIAEAETKGAPEPTKPEGEDHESEDRLEDRRDDRQPGATGPQQAGGCEDGCREHGSC